MKAIPKDSRLRYHCQLRQSVEERRADTHPLTWRLREDGARVGYQEYCAKEGYQGAMLSLKECTPDD